MWATVNYKVQISDNAVVNVIKRDCNKSVNKSNHPNWNPSFSSRVPPYIDNMNGCVDVNETHKGCVEHT
jgi:hypothetical protein